MAEKMISTAAAAGALAQRRQQEHADAQGVYARLMIRESLTPDEAESLAKAVAVLNVPGETIAAHSRAAERARHLHKIVQTAYSDETQKAREETRIAIDKYIAETDRIMAERMKALDRLREEQHRAEATYFAHRSAGNELRALEHEHPFIAGLSPPMTLEAAKTGLRHYPDKKA